MKKWVLLLISIALFLVSCAPNDLQDPFYAPAVYPNANNTGNVGSATQTWQNGYFTNLFVNGVPLAPGTAISWQGVWVALTPYIVNQAVSYNGSSYLCISGVTSATTPDLDPVHWGRLTQGYNWKGSWVSGNSYVPYDTVTDSGSTFMCILATSGTTIPANDGTHWSLMAAAGVTASLWSYKVDTTVGGTPASGEIRYDNATQISATNLLLSHVTSNNVNIDSFIDLLVAGQQLRIEDATTSTDYQLWQLSGPTVPSGSYDTLPVTLISSGGAGTTNFANNNPVSIIVLRIGPAGPNIVTAATLTNLSGIITGDGVNISVLSTVVGSIPVGVAGPVWSTLPIGANGKVLYSDGTTPSWQTVPTAGTLLYYLTDTNSDISNGSAIVTLDKKMTVAPFTPKTAIDIANNTNADVVLQTFATDAASPGLSFIPAGEYEFHIHAYRLSGSRNVTLYAVFREVTATGTNIGTIGTQTESTTTLTGSEVEYRLFMTDANTYTMASTSSRIVVDIHAVFTNNPPNGNTTVRMYVGDTADSHIALPSPTVDASNFVPYTGATTTVNLGSQALQFSSTIATNNSYNGVVTQYTAGANITQWQVCYLDTAGKMQPAKADSSTTMNADGTYLATAAVSTNNTGTFIVYGHARNDAWTWTIGGLIFVSDVTAGLLTQTAPTGTGHEVFVIGNAQSATTIEFKLLGPMMELN